jgi:hypothetical protein
MTYYCLTMFVMRKFEYLLALINPLRGEMVVFILTGACVTMHMLPVNAGIVGIVLAWQA